MLTAAERFASAMEARATVPMFSSGLTMPQWRAVRAIRRGGRANGRELAALLKLTPSAIVAICDHLEQMDLVRRVPDNNDRRVTWFVLTERGNELLVQASPDLSAAKSTLTTRVAGLSPCERDGFVKIANAFADAIGSVVRE